MRIYAIVFGLLLLVGAAAISAEKVIDYVNFRLAASQLQNDLFELKQIYGKNDAARACNTSETAGYQLRFTSDIDYVIEPICSNGDLGISPIKTNTLKNGVKRLYGSGIQLNYKNGEQAIDAWVHLQYKDKTAVVGLMQSKPDTIWNPGDMKIGGDSPALASCSDWGFQCCLLDQGGGSGVQAPGIDCIKSCYQYCNIKPSVVFFNTSPLMNSATRTVTLRGSRASVEFGYEINDPGKTVKSVIVSYGDGEEEEMTELKRSMLTHQYTCQTKTCVFNVSISVKSADNAVLTNTSKNQIKIVMTP